MRLTIPAMPAGSLAIEFLVSGFRRLILVAVAAGTVAGLVWFALQYLAVIPLIETAESYETAAPPIHAGATHEHDEGWHPAPGLQRNAFTAAATVLTSIGFASVLFGLWSLARRSLDARRGLLWGLAAFACVNVAPALGLPPRPPGAAVADLGNRQLWWLATVVATAVGLYLIVGQSRTWLLKLGGAVCLLLPHVAGAPIDAGQGVIPLSLAHQFVIASLTTTGVFWVTLGSVGGFLYRYFQLPPHH